MKIPITPSVGKLYRKISNNKIYFCIDVSKRTGDTEWMPECEHSIKLLCPDNKISTVFYSKDNHFFDFFNRENTPEKRKKRMNYNVETHMCGYPTRGRQND